MSGKFRAKSIFCNSLWIALVIILFLLIGHLFYLSTGDFRISYLLESQVKEPLAENFDNLNIDDEKIRNILDQEFRYLGHGNQAFAFVSEDEKYVLKVFKKDYFRRTPWIHIFPPIPPFRSFFLYSGKGREDRKAKLLNGYTTGFLYDRENCGLLCFHPFIQENASFKTSLITGLGLKIPIDLNQYVFAVQVKVKTAKSELSRLLSQRRITEAKWRIRQLLDLYFTSYHHGIFDNDHNLLDNAGFYENCAIRQDVGKIVKNNNLVKHSFVKGDLMKITDQRLGPWLQKQYPEYATEIILEMKNIVDVGLDNFPSK